MFSCIAMRKRVLFMQMRINMLKAREKKGLTQTELAKRVGTAQGTISRIESGENVPGSELGCKLAAELEIPLADLLQNMQESSDAEAAQ